MGLFSPIKINNLILPNRIMMSPAFSNSATADGHVTNNTIRHYVARARSGIGLIMTEHTSVNSYYLHPGNRLQISRDEHIDGLARLVKAVRNEGCRIGLQIAHSIHAVGLKPEDLSKETCYEIIEDFTAGARRAYRAGFDVIELHYAHTYTMADFLSRRTNGRTDEFGGDIYGRMRIHLEIVRRVREVVGRGYPLFARFSADDFVVGGNTLKQTRIFARELEKATIDCLDVSVGVRFDDGGLKGYSDIRGKPTIEYEDGPNVCFAEEIKKVVSIPVITVGKLGNPAFAAGVIEEGRADMIALARPLIADPMWVDKVRRGRFDLIHECIYCNSCLYDRIRPEDPVRCLTYPCRNECPADVDIPGYIDLAAQGRFTEAYLLIREENPFPLACGRVCHRPCEAACNRRRIDEPLAIKDLKRFITDEVIRQCGELPRPQAAAPNGRRVAVVGSGPSGLSCAFYLARLGYNITVFEALPFAGGIPAAAIPEYRLPRELLQKEIEAITGMGVKIALNTTVGKDILLSDLGRQGFQAVYIAIGAQMNSSLNVPGEDLDGIGEAIALLKRIKTGVTREEYCGKKVVVIGGGNVAIDVARSLVRLGAKVEIYCLEAANRMPAFAWEVDEALEEGVVINNGWGPKEFVARTSDRKVGVVVFKACVSVFDKYGNFNPTYDDSRTCRIACDEVVIAAGQKTDVSFNAGDLSVALNGANRIQARRDGQTSEPMIFAGGDCVSGPDSIIGGVRDGKAAASSIDSFFGGSGEVVAPRIRTETPSREISEEKADRARCYRISLEERKNTFTEIETGFSPVEARQEACRCQRCDITKRQREF
jgi:NADPH-dependent glutamate synthase beta subunit-like oxidoreductase/2,4-dienoyl-CoA reductase-like NADH-dependent reductase (Old Yellow Enzyme family)